MGIYLFLDECAFGELRLMGIWERRGQQRICWIQSDPNNLVTRQWYQPGQEPPFEPSNYKVLQQIA